MSCCNCCESREDEKNREVLKVIEELGLNVEEYKDVFIEILGGVEVIKGLSIICKTPHDYKMASDMLFPHYNKIKSRADGSASYPSALVKGIEEGRITTLEQLFDVAEKLGQINEAYWDINGDDAEGRGGGQFYEYLNAIVPRLEVKEVLG